MSFRDSLPRFLSNPYYSLLLSVTTLISVPLTIFLHFQSQQTRDLVFTVHPARTIIARAGRRGELKVEFKGEAIKTDVVGAQVAMWNQGKGSVHARDVLSPLEIRLNPPAPILQVSVDLRHRGPRSAPDVIILVTDCVMFVAAVGMLFVVFKWLPYVPTPPFGF